MAESRSNLLQSNSSDAYDSMKIIAKQTSTCFKDIGKFKKDFEQQLPQEVLESLSTFVVEGESTFSNIFNEGNIGGMGKDSRNQLIIAALMQLSSIEADISYLLTDMQENIRKTVEVAFAHLNRQIVADETVRNKWKNGWDENKREDFFESLGGLHLLGHKIWGFKANSEKERTDLILKEPINTQDPLYRSADGLVLTEWKKVKIQKEAFDIIDEAKRQASRYRRGSLASLELANHCYLVMISENELEIKDKTFVHDGVTFRIINIVCFPRTPSGKPI